MNPEGKDAKQSAATALPQFKKFVTEAELEEAKKKRQQEWERVRQPHQPVEAPPEAPEDMRSLYDRLQEQKDAKQAEHDEKYSLKNQVRGLDDDEAQFLESVYKYQEEVQQSRTKEEDELIAEYRNKIANQVVVERPAEASIKFTSLPTQNSEPKRVSQAQLLTGAIKRKRPSSTSEAQEKDLHNHRDAGGVYENAVEVTGAERNTIARVFAILPGIGVYTDSDDSDSSTDSEIDTDLFKRAKVSQQEVTGHQH